MFTNNPRVPGPCERCGKTAVELVVDVRKPVNGMMRTVPEARVFVTTARQCAMCSPASYPSAPPAPVQKVRRLRSTSRTRTYDAENPARRIALRRRAAS